MMSKTGARPGDRLFLSKPLGFGTTTTALKQQKAAPEHAQEVIDWMMRLNRDASQLALEFGARGATDITGFSLLGHAWEMAQASGVGMRFFYSQIPFVSGAKTYAHQWIYPGGSYDNRLYFSPHVRFAPDIPEEEQMLLFDAQTSGGLLLSVPASRAADILQAARERQIPLWEIGEVTTAQGIEVSI